MTEGCGKSYCDARSLRRHKENHHGADKDVAINGDDANVTVASTPALTVSAVALPVQKEVASLSSGLTATLVPNSSASGVLSNDNQSLPATKVTAKGLSPQQFQLIERLFKNSKNVTSTGTETRSGNPTSNAATTSISLNPSLDGKKTDDRERPLDPSQSQGIADQASL